MKKNLFFVLFIILSNFSIAQNYSREINWQTKIERSDNSFYLKFESAIYENVSNMLPYYYEQIYISDAYLSKNDVEIELTNQNFIAFDKTEISDVNHLEQIENEFSFEYKIVQNRKKSYLTIEFIPLINENGQIKKLTSFDINIKLKRTVSEKIATNNSFATNSVLNSGSWVKIKIPQTGVYKLTYSELKELGFSTPENVRVFGNDIGMQPFWNNEDRADDLIENKIYRGSDYILFFAKNSDVWHYDDENDIFKLKKHIYSNYAYYFLTDKNTGYNNIISTENQSTNASNFDVSSYDNYGYHEIDTVNLLKSGRKWYGERFEYNNNVDVDFNLTNLISNSIVKLQISLIARSTSNSSFNLSSTNLNETITVPKIINTDEHALWAQTKTEIISFPAPNQNNINLNIAFQGNASAKGWLDFIVINGRCNLYYSNQQLIFRDLSSVKSGNITNFTVSNTNSNVIIWDITDSNQPKNINSSFSNNTTTFKISTETLREFIAFEYSNTLTPILSGYGTGTISNQNLHGVSGEVDMVIFTHPNFLSQAEEIAEIHRDNDNLNVYVATTEQVYNEFSSGMPDVSAIKYFIKMIYERGDSDPIKYLLLLGDGTFKNKNEEPSSDKNSNFILTYQSDSSLNETNQENDKVLTFVSDDYFGLLDDNEGEYFGALDIGIGRLPVKTTAEAEAMISKIKSYLNKENMNSSRNDICFIADDEDSNTHMIQAEDICRKLDTLYPVFNLKKIYIDAFYQETSSIGDAYPAATEAVNNRIEQGALIIDYIGHGSPSRLTHEAVIQKNDILNWSNFERLPLFVTATCEFSRYDDFDQVDGVNETSAGELVVLNPNGGAIAMLTTTRVVYSGDNDRLNENFFKFAFEKIDNQKLAFGDLVRLTKNETGGLNQLNFTLLGDPALKLQYAEYKANVTEVNSISIENELDTIKSLSKVTVKGEITDLQKNKLIDFNGTVFPTVFDKFQNLETLNNDGHGVFNYVLQNNIIYKGRASVTNGEFEFSFIVPKDIMYNYGNGKISLYATNYEEDAKGYYSDIIIGGSSGGEITDEIGPEIKLYINDETFVDGSITDENPKIYALLSDSSGVNTVGNGIGHDITIVLDKEVKNTKVLNEFYIADLDSYQSGKVEYNLYRLEPGEHSVKLKVWDVYNNSSTEEIDFIVIDNEDFTIDRLYNYPNPFTTKTSFFFEHNMPGVELDVLIQIFTVSGKLVKTIDYQMISNGYKSDAIQWDGLDDYGSKIGKGVYIYRVKVKAPGDKIVEKFEKLLILK